MKFQQRMVMGIGLIGLMTLPALSQMRTWDGNGAVDSSGNWSAAVNWSDDNAPDSAIEHATLPNVSAGTRTVTLDAPVNIGQLQMTQSTVASTNTMILGAALATTNLMLSATAGGLGLDLNGQTLIVSNNASTRIILDGAVTMGNGSQFVMSYGAGGAADNRGMVFTNRGTLFQDGSTMTWFWNAVSGNNDGSTLGRNYINTGLWVLTNGAAFLFTGPGSVGGYGTLGFCTNSGTLRVVAGSTNVFGRLFNLGVVELGNNSLVGSPNSTIVLNSSGTFTASGTNSSIAGGGIANNLMTGNSGSFAIGAGATPAELFMSSGAVTFSNAPNSLITAVPGSRLIMRYSGQSGGCLFQNAGSFTQDNVAIQFDWANGLPEGTGVREFYNSGSWVLQNGSVLDSVSVSNKSLTWCLMASTNAGTLRVLSGSQLAGRGFFNTGTLELGANSVLSGPKFITSAPKLNNLGGIVTVSGNALFGATNEAGTVLLNNGLSSVSNGIVTVGDGANTPTLTLLAGLGAVFANYAGNSVTVSGGATLALKTFDDSIGGLNTVRSSVITNSGSFLLAGRIQQAGNYTGDNLIDNYGTFSVSGAAASIERLTNASASYLAPRFINRAGAVVTGSGTLVYTNTTGAATANTYMLNNSGTIMPGNPVGTLELINTCVTNIGGKLAIQLYDATTFDKLKVSGIGAKFDLSGAGDILDVSLVGRYRWDATTTFRIFEGGPVTDNGFETLLWNGAPVSGEYTVVYGANTIDLVVPGGNGTLIIIR